MNSRLEPSKTVWIPNDACVKSDKDMPKSNEFAYILLT